MNNRQKKEYEIIKQLATESDITLLSTEYEDSHSPLVLKCNKDDHEWSPPATNFKGSKNKKGSRCPLCAGNLPLTIQDAIDAAAKNEGWCLSKKIVNASKPLEWKCKIPEHSPWKASLYSIRGKQKTWCKICSSIRTGLKKQLGIEYFQQIAFDRGGVCLTKEYVNRDMTLEFECSFEHKFSLIARSVQAGGWCNDCRKSYDQKYVQNYFEQIFAAPFPETRSLEWLKDIRKLELDGYNEKLKIAFEYQGPHHYRSMKYGKKDNPRMKKVKPHDRMKVDECNKRGVALFIIPTFKEKLNKSDLENYITKEAEELGVSNKIVNRDIVPDLKKIYEVGFKEKEEKIKKYVQTKKGVLLSRFEGDMGIKLKIRCKNNHAFEKFPGHCLWKSSLSWCPDCSHSKKKTLSDINDYAAQRNWRFLADRYENQKTSYEWYCIKHNHKWKATYKNLQRGAHKGCKYCWKEK